MPSELSPRPHEAREKPYSIKKLLVAHDLSDAANRALTEAQFLADRFSADLVVAHIQSPEPGAPPESGPSHLKIQKLTTALKDRGHRLRASVRTESDAASIAEIVAEEAPDLLLLGAYGHGSQIRETLGSTAERLLRSIPCPVLIYGPHVSRSLAEAKGEISILLAVELPFNPVHLEFAVDIAHLFGARLEVLHVVDTSRTMSFPHAYQDAQFACEEIGRHLEGGKAQVSASLLFGNPPDAITARSRELGNSLIIIPLDTRRYLSSRTSDNVAAKVIRKAEVPVMTYRFDI